MRRPAWPSGRQVHTCLRTGPTRRSWGHEWGCAHFRECALRREPREQVGSLRTEEPEAWPEGPARKPGHPPAGRPALSPAGQGAQRLFC